MRKTNICWSDVNVTIGSTHFKIQRADQQNKNIILCMTIYEEKHIPASDRKIKDKIINYSKWMQTFKYMPNCNFYSIHFILFLLVFKWVENGNAAI